jgi:serine protease Do
MGPVPLSPGGDAMARELEGLSRLVRPWTVEVTSRAGDSRGSGVVWYADGLVVTNAHVARAGRLSVALPDERVVDARVVARDTQRDLALLSLDGAGLLSPASVGDPDTLRAGSLVLAMGHPLGVAHALSLGVVHAVTRERGRPRFIATDIRLAPGNSGGPLVDSAGRLMGINTMIVGGLGVAIPANVVRRFLREAAAAGAGIRTRHVAA